MRILQIRFKNLNSLAGEWLIDLTHPAYAAEGIFAITGPTGAGKSTLLDAICLALYGRTPRLNRISKSTNEIMSRQTGECFAEVSFATRSGRYRCHWSQHRARKKAGGELQNPKHEIADADSGEIFESSLRGVAEHVEAVTGMDFDRFTRSMLLAQGGFAAFLQAAADERAPILEQITGTGIYSEISIAVHERRRAEAGKLELLQAQTAGIQLLEPEQEREIAQALQARQHEEKALAVQVTETDRAIAWLGGLAKLQEETHQLQQQSVQLQEELVAFQPQREQLARAVQAATLDGAYATLRAMRKQQTDEQAALQDRQQALPELEAAYTQLTASLQQARQQSAECKSNREQALPVWQQVRLLDQSLAELHQRVVKGKDYCSEEEGKIATGQATRQRLQQQQQAVAEARQKLDGWLQQHVQDEWLVSGLAAVEQQFADLHSRQQQAGAKELDQAAADTALQLAASAVKQSSAQSQQQQRVLQQADAQLQQGQQELEQLLGGRLLREYRSEKDSLLRELALLAKIAELEHHRNQLQDGQPCPLCGASQHPYALGQVPQPDQTEQRVAALTGLIERAEMLQVRLQQLQMARQQQQHALLSAQQREESARENHAAAGAALLRANQDVQQLQVELTQSRQAIFVRLQPLGITDRDGLELTALLDGLRARLHHWQEQTAMRVQVEKQLADVDGRINQLDAVLATQSEGLEVQRARLQALQQQLAEERSRREALYGDKSPDVEENRINQALHSAEAAERQALHSLNQAEQRWRAAQVQIETLSGYLAQRKPQLQQLESNFIQQLADAGFDSEEAFFAAVLPTDNRAELATAAAQLDERQTRLAAWQQDRQARLTTETALQVSDKTLAELELQQVEQEQDLRDLRNALAGFKQRLSDNAAAKARIQAQFAAIEAQIKECRRWDNLHELIGSADGKKYRNFAQGLTFELMVGHANRQLQKMTDRYLLLRDVSEPLELCVVDNYQAGEVRSTKNLSGGESFIVSLSLALGLSQMASQNVRVDSLFLDEGFGTLDEEALDTALETLAGLQQDGKLIGVISHVAALKERIGTQIQVSPQTGGRSRITGPGCVAG